MNFSGVTGWFNQLLERGSEYYYRLKQLETQAKVQKETTKAQIEAEKEKTKQILYFSMVVIALAVGVKLIKALR